MRSTSQGGEPFVYDPVAPGFDHELYDIYRVLRDHHPVYVSPEGSYVLSRFADVWEAVHNPETFSSTCAEADQLMPQMIYMDPPRHTALRSLVSRAFTPRRVAALEDRIRQVARELLASMAGRDDVDLVHDLAAPLPSTVMADLIGVPEEHREAFRGWTEAFLEVTGPQDIAERATNIYELFGHLLEARRRAPTDDLMSALVAAEVDGAHLREDDLLGFCFLLLVAGNDTTASLIGSGAELLARHRRARADLVADPTGIPMAVEEMVRIESPTQALPRTATEDVELHGVTIPKGARVMLLWGSANHDEREFPDPERFDIHRDAARHLGFGHGAHFCIGAPLARLEARVAFEELLAAMPEYQIVGDPEHYVSNWARAWRVLPVEAAA